MLSVERLRRTELLKDVGGSVLSLLIAEGGFTAIRYQKDALVRHQGNVCETLDVIMSGSLAAVSLLENGSLATMFELGKGSIIGANLLFAEYQHYPLHICAVTDCELLHISKRTVLALLEDHAFVMAFIAALSANSQWMNKKIMSLTQKTLRVNIMEYLRQQSVLQGSAVITLPISKKELADRLGVQRPSLFREFKRLSDERMIEVQNRRIRLL